MDVNTTVVTAGDANFAWGTFLLVASMRMNGMKQPVLVGAMGWSDEMKRRVEALGGVTIKDLPLSRQSSSTANGRGSSKRGTGRFKTCCRLMSRS